MQKISSFRDFLTLKILNSAERLLRQKGAACPNPKSCGLTGCDLATIHHLREDILARNEVGE